MASLAGVSPRLARRCGGRAGRGRCVSGRAGLSQPDGWLSRTAGSAGRLGQSTQGTPFLALTAPPCAPVVGMATAEPDEDEDGEAPGTAAFPPSMTWT
jgi:hypothetical protein